MKKKKKPKKKPKKIKYGETHPCLGSKELTDS